ncbi:hypothetical protein CY34DRAFT_797233 [Suillus luteus UH-Slu-Lm8-n1]|uniref:Uncharacterized protein n=1 Tax=Suillus luteus UH-Slu-Lm8-n1 TaxID=930992 RepID=A0A0D0BUS9_9AGAM|nr:hypothetical protein CY34DRAFT_797233 [Suillus luteus UH-Slu-Lm8-n1]
MRFSSAIALAVVAALASSVSATPIDDNAETCHIWCVADIECSTCGSLGGVCVSINSFSWIDNMTRLHGRAFFSAMA